MLRDSDGYAPGMLLLRAAETNDLEIVRRLLELGVSVFEADADANTALHYAAVRNLLPIARLLLAHGADPLVDNRHRMSAFDASLCMRNTVLRRIFRPSESDIDLTPQARHPNPDPDPDPDPILNPNPNANPNPNPNPNPNLDLDPNPNPNPTP